MKRALFLLLDEYADWEAAYLSATLNEGKEWTVSTISLHDQVTSIGGFKTAVDYKINNHPDFDLLVLIGGNKWDVESNDIFNLVGEAITKNTPVGAICGAVDYLARNGFLNHFRHTGNSAYFWQDYESYNPDAEFMEKQAVKDKNLVTANGTEPIEFTELVLHMVNFDTAEEIEKTMYMYRYGYYEYAEKYGSPFS
ncbi:type 1 glutamine amidotransferase family protein [Marinococcus luteus]|uniref:type 1 glutamine amidotransferase family protein n=1 Tax=Marinococcus luteus TaxID=1122204 RepID=UPI002ACC9190|nr:type 1 glutamine amidotransferase family protein [Marinococcus luteus]MDZ5783100.1 type 1 glutamine amidotransferase family protein [Marinococcus luteus]